MRIKKIRGHSRIQKKILKWSEAHWDLDIEKLLEINYQYAQINLVPWLNKPIKNSEISEPSGYTKRIILESLEIIYDNWKSQLEKLDQPYYLKIWLHEPRISQSEIVCGLKGKIEEFENSFNKINSEVNKSNLINQMNSHFKWECALDEDFILASAVNSENYISIDEFSSNKRLLIKALKNEFRNKIVKDSNGEKDILYFIPKGKIWIGGK